MFEKMKESIEFGTLFSLLCTMVGTGILQLPLTLKQGGWMCVILIILVAVLTNTTGKWLIKCLHSAHDSNQRLTDYPAIGEEACGKCGRLTVQIFHKATLLGVTSIFLVLSAKFLLEGIGGGGEGFVPSLGTKEDAASWQKTWAIVAGVIVLFPVVFIRTMREITPLSIFGMMASLLCVVEIVIFALIIQPVTLSSASKYDLPVPPSFYNRTNIADGGSVQYSIFTPAQFPVAFSAITLSFGGHAVFPDIEKHMKHPWKFQTTFNAAYILLLMLYLLAAVFGFYTFGDITYSPVLCNFPRSTETTMGAITASTKLLIAFHVMSAYPILMNVLTTEIERGLGFNAAAEDTMEKEDSNESEGEGRRYSLLDATGSITSDSEAGADTWVKFSGRTLLRTCLVSLTCCIAIFVPFFGLLMELVGALCLTMMVFVLPVLFSWSLWGDEMTMGQKVWGIFIVAVGLIGGFIGTVQALQNIATSLAAGRHE